MPTEADHIINCAASDGVHCPHLADVKHRLQKVETMLEQNTKDTSEIVEILQAAKGFFRVANGVGELIKWIVSVGAAIGAATYLFKK